MENASKILYLLYCELLLTAMTIGLLLLQGGSSPQIITAEKDYKEQGNISDENDPVIDFDRDVIKQLAKNLVDSAPAYLNVGSLSLPPARIFNHLEIFSRKDEDLRGLCRILEAKG
ncbi:unnamed protein product [Urochloa humidicola]